LAKGPKQHAVGDGALGFWKALGKIYGNTRGQWCWVHKTANVMNRLPRSLQTMTKAKLHEIWMAADKDPAMRHLDDFSKIYGERYPKATECL
jgi:putative transposase